MTRSALPFTAPDLSALARFLERTLDDHLVTHGSLPGHVEMMNLLARSVGQRNLQAFQAASSAASSLAPTRQAPEPPADDAWFHAPVIVEPPAPVAAPLELTSHARKALAHFDVAGRLVRWPQKLSIQRLAIWVLWTRFDGRRVYTESEVNAVLRAWHTWGDHATLRRELINHRLMTRRSDCSEYRKLPLRPDAEVQALLQALRDAGRRRSTRGTRRMARPASAPACSSEAATSAPVPAPH
jgi:hypothetical protein